jgi:uncharacterized protein (DUF1697 family)
MKAPDTFAAVLRGVNVGGRNRLPMRELAALFRALGHEDVVTYIQSGNVVFRTEGRPGEIARGIEAGIADRFGLDVTVIIRNRHELVAVALSSPFLVADPKQLQVVFLDRPPVADVVSALDPGRSPGDEFRVEGSEIYLRLPNGAGRTKLTLDWFERGLGVAGTARNWNTLLRPIELTSERAGG